MNISWDTVRDDVIGTNATIETPYGERRLTYADYTASGRGLHSIERYISHLLALYANTHTEDDSTGRITSRRLAAAEGLIKQRLHAGGNYKLIAVGAGATAAVTRLQQILGIHMPPATRSRLSEAGVDFRDPAVMRARPVVFVGPYEHHSNEISWREGFAEVVEVELDHLGYLDLQDMEHKLQDPRWEGRTRYGSFSAASNVSGIRTDVYEVARLCHRNGVPVFFDFSASAPYVDINVSRDDEAYFDGVFFSPHKYLGGPGAGGVLLIRDELYRRDLPPSVSGGGTVSFVNAAGQDYLDDIEEREKAGTPGIIQTIRSALVLDLQHHLGPEAIEARERELIGRAVKRLSAMKEIEIIGSAPPEDRLAIFSFNIRSGDSYLHPRFVVRLLNDLFGIQSRAGCSCAGPYGHRLLHIDLETSEMYRRLIRQGEHGVKPGWVRLNFHYLLTDDQFDFLCSAIEFVTRRGRYFLPDYRFDRYGGAWMHTDEVGEMEELSAPEAYREWPVVSSADTNRWSYLDQAEALARQRERSFSEASLGAVAEELIPFWVSNRYASDAGAMEGARES